MVHSYASAERIWQSSSVIIDPQTGNWAGPLLEGTEWVVDVDPGRDGPENFEKTSSCGPTVKARGLAFRIWPKQISLGLDRQRWVEICDKMCRAWAGGQYGMVSIHNKITFYCRCAENYGTNNSLSDSLSYRVFLIWNRYWTRLKYTNIEISTFFL